MKQQKPKTMDPEHDQAIADLVAESMTHPDELARDIDKIAKSMSAFVNTRLKWSTLITLLAEDSKVGKRDVEKVLKAAVGLRNHLKPETKKGD